MAVRHTEAIAEDVERVPILAFSDHARPHAAGRAVARLSGKRGFERIMRLVAREGQFSPSSAAPFGAWRCMNP